MRVIERVSRNNNCTLELSSNHIDCLNLGSYNYLGFADDWMKTCGRQVISTLEKWPLSTCSPRSDSGTTIIHENLGLCSAPQVHNYCI